MIAPVTPLHSDVNSLSALRHQAARDPQAALEQAAKQFEALLTHQMMKSMRATTFGDDGSGKHSKNYRDMLDGQLAQTLAHSGRGLGVAEQLISSLRSPTAQGNTPVADNAVMKRNDTGYASVGPIGPSGPNGPAGPRGPLGPNGPSGFADPMQSRRELRQVSAYAQTTASAHTQTSPSTRKGGFPDVSTQSPMAPETADPIARAEDHIAREAVLGNSVADSSTRAKNFVMNLLPEATVAARELGVPVRAILAHAALETGWGDKAPGNNYFGIKTHGSWSGAATTRQTLEYEGGAFRTSYAAFREYSSLSSGFGDYVAFLRSNPRYATAIATSSGEAFLQGVADAGYATDPDYAAKLKAVYKSPLLDAALRSIESNAPWSSS
ncbi:flagellar assembly peptidoglycan hydrolase FlgJ [Algiphilus sp.]|uniref:flagellar assembly peptidoglycan hydrolase FlgJ n=1 Tax=Algiphilus sp. TaxID=1872431 RepID=UPI0032EB5EA1